MGLQGRKALLIVGGIVTIVIITLFVALLLFDINSFKSKIEATVSGTTGLDVRINGKMGLSFFPFGLWAKDLHFADKGGEILSIEELKLRAELKPLLKKQLKVTACELVKPAITIVKESSGRFNFESIEEELRKGQRGISCSLDELKASGGTLVYLDRKKGEKTELKEINLAIRDLLIVDISGDITRNVSFTGTMGCRELQKKDLKINDIRGGIQAEKGVFSLKPFTMDIFGAKGEGDVTADKSKHDILYRINVNVAKMDFEKLQESFGVAKLISGRGDLAASLTVKKKGERSLVKGMEGTLSIRGNNLTTYTVDLDRVLSSYETSQKFDLVDIGAFLIAGPLGTVALKGYRYGDVYYQTRGGQGTITHFVSHWKIRAGVADATDCALATHHNRVALKGRLNLVSEQYNNVTVALLDDKGCAKFTQDISGPFGSPRVSAISAMESLAGPILDLYRKAKRFAQAGKCEVFYNGSVQQPR